MAKSTKLKAAAQGVPQSREEADTLLGEIGELSRQLDRIDGVLTAEIAAAKKRAADEAGPIAAEIKAKFSALMAWAEANKDRLLDGRRRSVAFSQGLIGWRWSNPAVKIARGQEEAVIETLRRLGLNSPALAALVRLTPSLDKEAILADPRLIKDIPGIAVEQTEVFFAKPLDVRAEQIATAAKVTGPAANNPAEAA